ncbi:hypothetical protein GLOIN_2v1884468 [Rhizophagus irregularis DAOM 181602=DAOM 197198]|uniref:Uncharacterized protein n=1 Tax=Rhizophagus irregularis (strain DAOM 181602 / DAOM 197198 / MUCL 43194) TaxID=747089 RepID=A0A2P4P4D6_RHIID|nr:hypothetical protein GLOIN_2v1884468 [Rhizophagus irregularis DAOM 181602=DAOM 197198]POG60247.1 hypothetical protein GLOIN_2v1884468 [Rhizophagus irregularis DAOM 181602=DAOM 197198]|eukprot:XP_025167113.1 hypothetical protein GLOIN_2v1884468 [Rhizophagus irregularis DAOM 181602=DAOM 197198]
MNLRQIFFALLIVLMATIVTASPLNLDQLIKEKMLKKMKKKTAKSRLQAAPSLFIIFCILETFYQALFILTLIFSIISKHDINN